LEDPSSYELEPERRGWRRLGPWLRTGPGIACVVAVVLFGIVAWQAQPLYRLAKVWRVKRLVAQVEAAERRGDEAAETRDLRKAFTLLPAHAITWRALAHYHDRRGEGAALVAYQQLLSTEQATPEDAIRACRQAALRAPAEVGRKILALAEPLPGVRDLPAVMILRARLLGAANAWPDALALAQKAVEKPDADAPERLVLANLLLQAADRAPLAERIPLAERAVDLLAELTTRPDDSAVEALSALISLARQPAAAQLLTGRDVAGWIEAAERHPKASARLRVLAWNLQLVGKRDDAEKFFAAFLEKSRESPLAHRLEAARWLNQHSRPRQSLELSTSQKDMSQEWFLVHLDSLAATGQWRVVLQNLEAKTGQGAVMPPPLRALFAMRARTELRQTIDPAEIWRDIQIQLQSEPVQTQVYIAQYAEKTGELKHAATIYRQVLSGATSAASFDRAVSRDAKLACYTGIIRSLPPTASVAEVLPLMEELSAEFPELDEARNDTIYLRLLAGHAPAPMRDDITKLLERNAAMLAYRTTAALLELRAGNAAAAEKLYTDWKIDWSTAADRFKAVRAAVLTTAGRSEEAKEMRAQVKESNLRPEEAALLR
jgi:hypothetical protein